MRVGESWRCATVCLCYCSPISRGIAPRSFEILNKLLLLCLHFSLPCLRTQTDFLPSIALLLFDKGSASNLGPHTARAAGSCVCCAHHVRRTTAQHCKQKRRPQRSGFYIMGDPTGPRQAHAEGVDQARSETSKPRARVRGSGSQVRRLDDDNTVKTTSGDTGPSFQHVCCDGRFGGNLGLVRQRQGDRLASANATPSCPSSPPCCRQLPPRPRRRVDRHHPWWLPKLNNRY